MVDAFIDSQDLCYKERLKIIPPSTASQIIRTSYYEYVTTEDIKLFTETVAVLIFDLLRQHNTVAARAAIVTAYNTIGMNETVEGIDTISKEISCIDLDIEVRSLVSNISALHSR